MSGFFQRLFGKDNKPAIARGPLGLHLNSGFTLDTLAFRLLEDELLIALPGIYGSRCQPHRSGRR